jgi:hypothetical protein
MFSLDKFSLVITTRCNLRCRLCCEYVPQHEPFPDMSVEKAERLLAAAFTVCDRIGVLHLTGGGEPFLHPELPALIDAACRHADRFDHLMLFSNSTVPVKPELLDAILSNRGKIVIRLSRYGLHPKREQMIAETLTGNGIRCKVEKYHGESQAFGGWVDFGPWEARNRTPDELETVFHDCAVTRDMRGNWRTRDGRVHWCSRSQRGMELGLLPDDPADYVDLLDDSTSVAEKRARFEAITAARYLSACQRCSGDQGTTDTRKRFRAAEQSPVVNLKPPLQATKTGNHQGTSKNP